MIKKYDCYETKRNELYVLYDDYAELLRVLETIKFESENPVRSWSETFDRISEVATKGLKGGS
jgi:hypothetical protein